MTKNQLFNTSLISTKNIDFLLFIGFLASFFLHYRINGFMAMLIIIFFVIKLLLRKSDFSGGMGLFFFPALFITLLIGQLYTDDIKEGWTIVERNISLLILPFAAKAIIDFSEKQKQVLFTVFIVTGAIATFVCLTIASYHSIDAGSIYTIPNNTHFLYNRFMHHRLSDPIGLHAVYFSLYLALINLVLLHRIITSQRFSRFTLGLILLFLYFCIFLYLLKSANIAVGFAISVCLLLFQRYKNNFSANRIKFTIIGLTILCFTIYSVKNKLEHFNFNYDISDPTLSMIGIRMAIWDCTWQAIQESWLLGAGTGDAHHALIEKYKINNFNIGLTNDFNSHNMFLQYWLSNGLLALGLFLSGFLILFRKSIQYKNLIFFSFILLFTLFSITESTLRTQKGLLFFVFFAGLFYWYPQLWNKQSTES